MNRPLTLLGIVGVLASCLPGVLLIAAHSQASKPPSELSESEARRILTDSPWAKRTKLRSTTKAAPYNQPIENPGTAPGGLGRGGGLGHGTVAPSAADLANISAAPKVMPCLGWGLGSMSLPSPTSQECQAAWQSVAVAKYSSLPPGSVIILWESAAPVSDARTRLAIAGSPATQASDPVIIQMIAHPLLREINTTAISMRQMIKESAVLLRNGKDRVEASDISFIETNEAIVRFFFPRRQTIKAGNKDLIFRFEMLDTLVEAKFSLKDMAYRGQPAL
jgi:hypothetical protein